MTAKYTVAANLKANSGQFVAGFAAATKAVQGFSSAVAKANTATATSMNAIRQSTGNATAGLRDLNKTSKDAHSNLQKYGTLAATAASGVEKVDKSSKSASTGIDKAGHSSARAYNRFLTLGTAAGAVSSGIRNMDKAVGAVSFGKLALGAAALYAAIKPVQIFTSYEQALAGVKKVVDATDEEYRQLDLTFRKMSRTLPSTYEEIANTAEVVAQLGVEKENIAKFTDTMIRMGTSTNLSSEDAAKAMSRMLNIMKSSQGDADRLGSVIVKLGNNFATTESEIVDMSMRIASTGKMLGMTEGDVLALSASLSNLGVTAEVGGSAMSTIMSKTASDIERGTERGREWAKVMGMSIEKAQKLFKKDSYQGMVKMVEGLEKIKEAGGNVDKTLRDLGINEIRQLNVMKSMVGSSKELTAAQKMANDEWRINNALIKESNARNETFGSKMKMLLNGIRNIASNIGEAFAKSDGNALNVITNIINYLENLTNKFIDADGTISQFGQKFVDTIVGIGKTVGIIAAVATAFNVFGVAGAVTVGVVAGVAVIGSEIKKLVDRFNEAKTGIGRASQEISNGLSKATEGQAQKYFKLRDDINTAVGDIRVRTTDEARKTKSEVLSEVDDLTNQVISTIRNKQNEIVSINKRLLASATGTEKAMLEGTLKDIEAHYNKQVELARDAGGTITKTIKQAYDERRNLTNEEFGTLSNMFSVLDGVYKTHVAKNVDEMAKLSRASEEFDKNTSFENVQKNLTSYTKAAVSALSELEKGYKNQAETIKAAGLPLETQKSLLDSLTREYQVNRDAIIQNLDGYEQQAQKLHKSADAMKGLTKEQKELLGTVELSRQEFGKYNAATDTYANGTDSVVTKTKSLSDAARESKDAMEQARQTVNQTAEAYLGAGKNITTIQSAFEELKTSAPETARAIGQGFVAEMENGIGMVDLGERGRVKVDEFVEGVRSGEYSIKDTAIAQINAMRHQIGVQSLTSEGYDKINEFVQGLRNGDLLISDVTSKLGLNLKSGMKVDLGNEGKMSIDEFIAGIKSGEYGVVEVMTMYQNRLKELSKTDLTAIGHEDIQTLKAGIEGGFISIDQVMAAFEPRIQEGAKANLTGAGEVTIQSLIEGYSSGQLSIETFMLGLKALVESSSKTDLTASGSETIASFSQGISSGIPALDIAVNGAKTTVEGKLNEVETASAADKAINMFSGRISALSGVPAGEAAKVKVGVETELGKTTDGGGGQKATSSLSANLNKGQPFVVGTAFGLSDAVGKMLGLTSDKGGGKKATNEMTTGINHGANLAKAAANGAKYNVEKTLGSTTDGKGGNKAGTKFSSDLKAKEGTSRSAANSHKTTVERLLGSTTDGRGGSKSGSMFASGLRGQSGNAQSAGSSVSNSGRSGLSANSNTYHLGTYFGSGFVNGIRSFIGAAINAATALASAALNAVKAAQRSASPAKETIKLGQYFGDGFALAIESKGKDAAKAARSMTDEALDAVNKYAEDGFDLGDALSPNNGSVDLTKRISNELSTNGSVELTGKQPAYINVNVGGQEFEAFSDNIYSANTRRLNFKDRFER